MTEREYQSNLALREKLVAGVEKLADNVASTYGPRGRTVIIHPKDKTPTITKDGVTVSRAVKLKDPFENAAAQIIKQAAEKTASDAGDGTTTAIVLARSIYIKAQKYIAAGASPVEIKRGVDKTVEAITGRLKDLSSPIKSAEDIEHIATISANGDKIIGKLIATAVDLAGKDGAITIEEARSVETSLDVVEGFRFDSGYLSPKFITEERRGVVRYDDPLLLVTDAKLEGVEEILPVLEVVAREGRPLIIVAEEIEGQALAALIMNAMRGSLKVAAVKAPRYGEERRNILKDLAIATGATFISRESNKNLKDIKLTDLGTSKTIEISKGWTTIVGGNGDTEQITNRIEVLKGEIEQTDSLHECEGIQERITRLASGIAIIRVGGATEVEMVEKRHRIEDALEAVRSAQLEGVVPGGGMALIMAARSIQAEMPNEDQAIGKKIVLETAFAPIRQMAQNAGDSPDLIADLAKRCKDGEGYDFRTGQVIQMVENGIIDPVKVTRCALQNAASAATTLITTNYAIIEV